MLTFCTFSLKLFRAGGPIKDESNKGNNINAPPLSVRLRQRMVEKIVKEDDGEIKRVSLLEGELFAVTAKFSDESLDLVCYDVVTLLESASSGEQCHSCVIN